MTTRRGFLGAMLAAATAPAVVGSGILMPIKTIVLPQRRFYAGDLWFDPKTGTMNVWNDGRWISTYHVIHGDGVHDDTQALQAAVDGFPVVFPDGRPFNMGAGMTFKTHAPLVLARS